VLIKRPGDIRSSEITSKALYLGRRAFLASAGASLAALSLGRLKVTAAGPQLAVTKRMITTTDRPTPYEAVTTFNNFYEFGADTDHGDPARHAGSFKPRPWSVTVEGQCAKPGVYTLEDILKPHPIEERVYRMRCVEGWSMVIPWDGFPLGDLLTRFEPSGSAKFVEFTSVLRPQEMVGQRQRFPELLPWPYTEGLRIDEAMHPLALIAVGVYGQALPNQNGAPLRLVVPWKYGFKGIKSIVKIRFVEKQPATSWQQEAPEYYAFYSNVNPGHTDSTYRDQSTERRIGEFLMRKTLLFNGYGDQVASLYATMNLQKYF
jgi:sulfoxide reductase catalytic subunit YedY